MESAMRLRRSRSHRPGLLVPCSITCGESLNTASTVPRRCRDPGAPEALHRALRGLCGALVVEQSVERRAGAAHVGAEGAVRAELLRERRRHEVVRGQRGEVARAAKAPERRVHGGAALVEAGGAAALVEGGIDRGGGRLLRVVREDEEDPEVLRHVERRELRAVAGPELRAVGEEEGHVGAEPCGEVVQVGRGKRLGQRRVGEPQRGGGVGAAAAETGRDGETLLDVHAPARLDAGACGERLERAAHERVGEEPVDAERERRLDVDPVGEGDALVHGDELVLAVVARGPDDEGEVDLRGRGCSHRSASVSATNSCGASASARTDASRPIDASAATERSRDASPLSSSEFGSVFRRCANAAATTFFTRAKLSGKPVRRNATSAESTFGRGRNTARETGCSPVRSVASCTSTETAPYAFVLGAANK